jgi:N-acetylglucosamine malate deacetylase 1
MKHEPCPIDVLAIGAHGDDIELGCSATLTKMRSLGYTIGLADISDASMGTRGSVEIREQEAIEAAVILDAEFRTNLGLPDGRLGEYVNEMDEAVIRLVRAARPSLVMIPHPADRHPDHIIVGTHVPDAAFRAGFRKLETGQEKHRPLKVIHYVLGMEFEPSFIVDVSGHWETKLASIRAYRSQFAVPGASQEEEQTYISSPEFLERIEARGRFYGAQIASRYGEPFYQVGPVVVRDPMSQAGGSLERLTVR